MLVWVIATHSAICLHERSADIRPDAWSPSIFTLRAIASVFGALVKATNTVAGMCDPPAAGWVAALVPPVKGSAPPPVTWCDAELLLGPCELAPPVGTYAPPPVNGSCETNDQHTYQLRKQTRQAANIQQTQTGTHHSSDPLGQESKSCGLPHSSRACLAW